MMRDHQAWDAFAQGVKGRCSCSGDSHYPQDGRPVLEASYRSAGIQRAEPADLLYRHSEGCKKQVEAAAEGR